MQKILFYISNFDINNLHGLSRIIYEICKRLRGNLKIFIYTNGDENLEYSLSDNIRVYQFNCLPLNIFKKIKERLEKEDIDKVFYIGNLLSALLLLHYVKSTKVILNLVGKKPSLSDFFHLKGADIYYDYKSTIFSYQLLLLVFPNFLIRKLLQKDSVDTIIVPSFRLERWYKKICPKLNIKRIAGGVDYEDFQNFNSEILNNLKSKLNPLDKKVLLYLGHIIADKGLDEVIRIAQDLSLEGYRIKLLLVLNDKVHSKYRNYFFKKIKVINGQKLDIEIINEYVKDVEYYYNVADFIILPYRFAPSLPEYPLVLLEAMSNGKIVCTYKVGAIGEIIKDGFNGVMAEVGDYNTLYQKIKKLLDNPEKQKAISGNARLDSAVYDWYFYSELVNDLLFHNDDKI